MTKETLETGTSPDHFLHSGEQTEITVNLRSISQEFVGTAEEKIHMILQFLRRLKYNSENKDSVFRKRTADQIVTDEYVTGCTDDALVFIALARACSIPAKYIETLDTDWIKHGGRPIQGHVYAGVYIDGEWILVDPAKRAFNVDIKNDNRVVLAEGLDSWDIGATDFETLVKNSDDFRDKNIM